MIELAANAIKTVLEEVQDVITALQTLLQQFNRRLQKCPFLPIPSIHPPVCQPV